MIKIPQGETKLILIVISVITLSFGSYWLGAYVQQGKYASFVESFRVIRENSGKYEHINPRIGSVSNTATEIGLYVDIKKKIVKYLSQQEEEGNLYGHSFYFRDLNSGLWFGDNETSSFFPASLFKLPVALAAYKQAEAEPEFLKKQFIYTQELFDSNNNNKFNAETSLVVGQTYTIEQLVQKMLVFSDNGAKDLLVGAMNPQYLDQLFEIVSIVDPSKAKSYEVSSRKYALFLSILYGSSYLNEDHSEFLLGLLTQSTFKDGIVAGVPDTVPVAHKFGVYDFSEKINDVEQTTTQLHDCGVIYHESKPYIFCMMSKGKDDDTLFKIISHVSKLIYDYQEQHAQESR